MYVIVRVPADDNRVKCPDMKDILAPRPAGYVPYDMRVNGCERERLDAIESTGDENVKDESRDIFVTVNSDHVSPQTMHEIAKLIAVLSDTGRDIHVNII